MRTMTDVEIEFYWEWMAARIETLRRERRLTKKASWQLAQREWSERYREYKREKRRQEAADALALD
jgi:hypothetical protein